MRTRSKVLIGVLFFVFDIIVFEIIFRTLYPQPPVMARILVQEGSENILSGLQMELDFPDSFINEAVLKEAFPSDLGGKGKAAAEDGLAKRVKVDREEGGQIIRIMVLGKDRKQSAEEANALAEAAVKYYNEKMRGNLSKKIETLRRDAEVKKKSILSLMGRIQSAKESKPNDSQAVEIDNEIRQREARVTALLETYKPQHPEIVKIQNEIKELKKQQALQPRLSANPLLSLQSNYESEMTAYREIQTNLNKRMLEKEIRMSPIKILSPAIAGEGPRRRSLPYSFFLVLAVILVASVCGVYWSRPKD